MVEHEGDTAMSTAVEQRRPSATASPLAVEGGSKATDGDGNQVTRRCSRQAGEAADDDGHTATMPVLILPPLATPSIISPSLQSPLISLHTPSLASSGLPSTDFHSSGSMLLPHHSASGVSYETATTVTLGSTRSDGVKEAKQMAQLGYNETLRRDYDAFSLFCLVVANLDEFLPPWSRLVSSEERSAGFLQGALFGSVGAFAYGGGSMLSIAWPITAIAFSAMSAILAELASAYPVAGAMMTWTFRLSRAIPQLRSSARFLSWIVGSFLLCAHVLSQMLISFQLGSVIHGSIRLYHPDYTASKGAVLAVSYGIIALSTAIACSSISRSPWLWRAVLAEIVVAWLVTIFALGLASNGPLLSAKEVFTTYTNETGFSNPALVYLIGWVQTCLATGQDAAVHMAEETKDASRSVPYAIFWANLLSYCCGWVAACVLYAAAGINPLENTSHTSPFAAGAVLTSHLSVPLSTLVIVLLIIAMFAQNVAQLTASSRYCWALARDNALPFSSIIRRVSSRDRIPRSAVLFLAACTLPGVTLVALVRGVATSVALQGSGFTILFAYAVPIALYVWAGPSVLDYDGRRQFSLRTASRPAAWVSLIAIALALVMFCFPTSSPVTTTSFSYSPVVLVGVFVLSCLSWIFYGNYHFAGPIKAVLGPDTELPRFVPLRSNATPGAAGTPRVEGTDKPTSAGVVTKEPGTTQVYFASELRPPLLTETSSRWATTTTGSEWTEGTETQFESRAETVTETRDEEGAVEAR